MGMSDNDIRLFWAGYDADHFALPPGMTEERGTGWDWCRRCLQDVTACKCVGKSPLTADTVFENGERAKQQRESE